MGMAAPDVISRSQLLPNGRAQQAFANGTVDALQQSPPAPDISTSAQGTSMLASHGRSPAVVAAEPRSAQSQQSVSGAPATVAPGAGTRRPQSTTQDLAIMDFVPSGKIESADFALYAQMHLHNPQFHQQQWERNDISPPHPVIESFPSFRTPRTTEDLDSEAAEPAEADPDNSAQQQQGQPAEAGAPTHLQGPEANNSSNAQHALPKGNSNAPSLSSSHSSMSSPTQQQQQPGLTATRRRSVSLLSQQLATARDTAAAAAAEYEAGTSGRHRSEFWRYLQEQRAKETAQMEAALQRSGHKKQQPQQQQHYALQPIILEVEEASPLSKHKKQQQPQQQQQQRQQRQQTHSQERQHLQQWQPHAVAHAAVQQQQQQQQQQLPPLPPKAQVLAKQQQQQSAPSNSPFAAVANGFGTSPGSAPPRGGAAAAAEGETTAEEPHVAKQAPNAGGTGGSAASPGLLDAALASQEAAGWSHQYISGCTDATAHHKKQRQDQQQGQQLPAQQQGQSASHEGSNHGGQQYQSSSVLEHQQSLEQPLLLHTESAADLAALDQRQHWPAQAWIFSDGLILPGDLQQQQQQQRYGLWARGFDHLGPPASSDGDYLGYTSLGQLPGDSVRLNQMLAAAAAGTPPAPRRGSKFDDMDSVSGSMHGASYYAGQQQQQQQRPGSAGLGRISFGGSSRDGSSYRSLTQLLAAVGVGTSSSVLAHGAGAAASAAAGVVTEHLDSLLCELSLFGERSAAEVGQELAVANSIQQMVSQHRLRSIQGYGEQGGGSSSRRQSSTGTIAAAHLHRSGMKQISGWVGSTIDRTSSWLARSATAVVRSMTGSSSGSNLGYGGSSTSRPAGGGLLADRSRRSLPAGHRGPAAAGTGGGTLWQYGGSSSSVGAAGRGAGQQQQQQQRGQPRQQQPLGQAARRWR